MNDWKNERIMVSSFKCNSSTFLMTPGSITNNNNNYCVVNYINILLLCMQLYFIYTVPFHQYSTTVLRKIKAKRERCKGWHLCGRMWNSCLSLPRPARPGHSDLIVQSGSSAAGETWLRSTTCQTDVAAVVCLLPHRRSGARCQRWGSGNRWSSAR